MATTLSSTGAAGWAQFQAGLAAAKQGWWGTAGSGAWQDYLANTASINGQYTTYQQTIDADYLAEMTATASPAGMAADVLADATADASAALQQATATAQAQYVNTVGATDANAVPGTAAATQTYLNAVAQANRNFAVNQANGVSTAATQQTADLKAAQSTYQTAAAADDGRLQTDLASANLNYVNATGGTTNLLSVTGADGVLSTSAAGLQYTCAVADSNAYAALQTALSGIDSETGDLGLNEAYLEQSADSYQAAIDAFALANPSPWASLADEKATAAATQAADDAEYLATWMQAAIGAQQSQASQQALAGKVLANANALASAVWASGTATVASGLASLQAAANNLAASFGMYQADLPVGPSLPTISQQAVDAVIKNDYTAPAVDLCYAGILANMFGTRTVEPESASGIEASVWSESLSGSTISGDLARLMNPALDTKTVGGVVEYYNELAPPHFNATTGQRVDTVAVRGGHRHDR